ncbi:MAG: hypothetical protein ACYC5A_11055 [Thermoleophilia bacterium]
MEKVTDKKYEEKLVVADAGELPILRAKDHHWSFFIVSRYLSGELEARNFINKSALLATNGLIILDHGHIFNDYWEPSSIGMVNKIANEKTHEVVSHDEYILIFNSLIKGIKKILCHKTKSISPNGTINDSEIMMSDGFAEMLRSGEIKPAAIIVD